MQHDCEPLANGNVTLFANGTNITTNPFSRVIELDPRTHKTVWEYRGKPTYTFFSPHISGAQRLASGNTLICEGQWGRLFEVTPEGDIVWEYVSPFMGPDRFGDPSNEVFRAYRYAADFAAASRAGPVDLRLVPRNDDCRPFAASWPRPEAGGARNLPDTSGPDGTFQAENRRYQGRSDADIDLSSLNLAPRVEAAGIHHVERYATPSISCGGRRRHSIAACGARRAAAAVAVGGNDRSAADRVRSCGDDLLSRPHGGRPRPAGANAQQRARARPQGVRDHRTDGALSG